MNNISELKTQFILSESGITPCWLVRENGEPVWRPFMGLVGVPAANLWPALKAQREKYPSLWDRDNLWKDDEKCRSWIKTNRKAAATLESILASNPLCRGLTCSIVAWSEGGAATDGFVIETPTLVRTTAELDAWIEKAQPILSGSDGVQVVPIMDLGLRYLATPFPPDQICYLKRKGWYISEVDEDSIVWDRNVHKAKALTGLEVSQLQTQYHSCRGAYLVNTSRAAFPFNAVIKVTEGEYAGKYIESIEEEIRFCSYAYLARRFRTEEDAKKTCDWVLLKNNDISSAEVELLS